MNIPVVKEHERVKSGDPGTQEQLIALAKRTTDQIKADRVLGLHLKPGESDPSAWWFVGQVWVKLGDDRYVLRVEPKIHNLAPVLMYAECMTHPLVRAHLGDCMYFYWDEPPIPVGKRDHPITPLVVMRYLWLLHELCQKHLRLMITPVEANLTARIRGKPLVHPTLRTNHARGRLDRTYCRFQVQSIDTVSNQILFAALCQAIRYLYLSPVRDQALSHLATFSANALSGVTLRRILPTDFQGLHYGGFLRPYREPHRWARLVLRLLGPDPLEEFTGVRETGLPPFAIDMSKLFERYCEVKLRNVAYQQVRPGYNDNSRNLGRDFKVRPDFLVRSMDHRWIVDAKYKDKWSWTKDEHKPDVCQVVSYCSHQAVLRELGLLPDSHQRPIAVILYPASPVDQVSDQKGGLDLQAAPNPLDVLRDFEVDVVRIPVSVPYAEASPSSRVPGDASDAVPGAKYGEPHIEREDGITLFTAFGRFAGA